MNDFEAMTGYCFNIDGTWENKTPLSSNADMTAFLQNNVMRYHELRIVDGDDFTVFHVVDRSLLFPPPLGISAIVWDDEAKKFKAVATH